MKYETDKIYCYYCHVFLGEREEEENPVLYMCTNCYRKRRETME